MAADPTVVTLAAWDGHLEQRRLQVHDGEIVVDMFGTPSEKKQLHVFLSAGGGALKDGVNPQFPRVSWHPWMDGASLNIDDPTFAAYPGKLQTGWYLGTPNQNAIVTVAAIVDKVRAYYGVRANDVYIIGSSAGATAALKLAAAIPGSTALVENPPLYPAESTSARHLLRAGLDQTDPVMLARNDLRHILGHESSRFVILQNVEDKPFIEQLQRFLKIAGMPKPSSGLNESGSLSLYLTSIPSLSPHHAFLSVHEFCSVLELVRSGAPLAPQVAVLDAVHESLRARILASDHLSNIKGWIRLKSELNVPLLEGLPTPSTADVVRIRLRDKQEVIYRIRMGHLAAKIFIAVNIGKNASASKTQIDSVATMLGATVSTLDGGFRIGLSGVPMVKAADKVNQFVEATAPLFD